MKHAEADPRLIGLFEKHYAEVLAYCVRRIGRAEAEDTAAEVFAIAWKRLDDIRMDSARAWLYGTARGVISNRWRSVKSRSRLSKRVAGFAPIPPETPDVYVVRREEDEEVVDTLKALKDSDQEILMLSAWEELSNAEIAEVLDISKSAAEQRLHRAKQRFAKVLEPSSPKISPRAAEERGGSR